jgi:hypothetical protein
MCKYFFIYFIYAYYVFYIFNKQNIKKSIYYSLNFSLICYNSYKNNKIIKVHHLLI